MSLTTTGVSNSTKGGVGAMLLLTAIEVACLIEVVGGTVFLDEVFTLGLFK